MGWSRAIYSPATKKKSTYLKIEKERANNLSEHTVNLLYITSENHSITDKAHRTCDTVLFLFPVKYQEILPGWKCPVRSSQHCNYGQEPQAARPIRRYEFNFQILNKVTESNRRDEPQGPMNLNGVHSPLLLVCLFWLGTFLFVYFLCLQTRPGLVSQISLWPVEKFSIDATLLRWDSDSSASPLQHCMSVLDVVS